MNLGLAQQAIAALNPDRECIVTPTRRLTYAQVAERARRLANVLHLNSLGCHRERSELQNHESGQDHLGIYMLNCPEYFESMLGSYLARARPITLTAAPPQQPLPRLPPDAGALAAASAARRAPTLARIRDGLPKRRLLRQCADESGTARRPVALHYEDARGAASAPIPPVQP